MDLLTPCKKDYSDSTEDQNVASEWIWALFVLRSLYNGMVSLCDSSHKEAGENMYISTLFQSQKIISD